FCLVVTAILGGLFLIRTIKIFEIAARWYPIFAKFADALGSVIERIPRGRMAALLLGSVLQGIVLATNKIATPELEFALTPEELIKFGLGGNVPPYVWIVNSPTRHFHLALMAVFVAAFVTAVIALWLRPNRISLTIAILMVIGGLQP